MLLIVAGWASSGLCEWDRVVDLIRGTVSHPQIVASPFNSPYLRSLIASPVAGLWPAGRELCFSSPVASSPPRPTLCTATAPAATNGLADHSELRLSTFRPCRETGGGGGGHKFASCPGPCRGQGTHLGTIREGCFFDGGGEREKSAGPFRQSPAPLALHQMTLSLHRTLLQATVRGDRFHLEARRAHIICTAISGPFVLSGDGSRCRGGVSE